MDDGWWGRLRRPGALHSNLTSAIQDCGHACAALVRYILPINRRPGPLFGKACSALLPIDRQMHCWKMPHCAALVLCNPPFTRDAGPVVMLALQIHFGTRNTNAAKYIRAMMTRIHKNVSCVRYQDGASAPTHHPHTPVPTDRQMSRFSAFFILIGIGTNRCIYTSTYLVKEQYSCGL